MYNEVPVTLFYVYPEILVQLLRSTWVGKKGYSAQIREFPFKRNFIVNNDGTWICRIGKDSSQINWPNILWLKLYCVILWVFVVWNLRRFINPVIWSSQEIVYASITNTNFVKANNVFPIVICNQQMLSMNRWYMFCVVTVELQITKYILLSLPDSWV